MDAQRESHVQKYVLHLRGTQATELRAAILIVN